MPLVLVVDPDPGSREALHKALLDLRFESELLADGEGLLARLDARAAAAAVLDIYSGTESGFALCRRIRETEATRDLPVVMITRSAHDTDRVLALEAGADDVITRPFSAKEAALRVRSVIRRAERAERGPVARIGGSSIEIQHENHLVRFADRDVQLSEREISILALLATAPGRVFTRDEILRLAWTTGEGVTARVVDTHVKTMRRKLGEFASVVRTVRGVGYCLEEPR